MRRSTAIAATAVAASAVSAGWIEPRRLVTVHRRLELPNWPSTLSGLRVGVLSDLHAGSLHAGLPAIARAVERLNAEAPDAMFLLGDYVDAHPLWGGRTAPEPVARELAALRSPLGTFAVLGNHDWRHAGDRMWSALQAAGIEVLENRAVAAGDLYIAGLADMRYRLPDVHGALAAVPGDAPAIVLSHDPDTFPSVPARVALTLAGHTHGGQIAIPVVRRLAIPSRYGDRYARGHVVEDGRHLYVTSGLGTSGLPLRLFAPPEVVVLELVASTA